MHNVQQTYLQKSSSKKTLGVASLMLLIAGALLALSTFAFATQSAYASEDAQAVYRMYNAATSEHLFTTDENEYNSLTTEGWEQEDVSWYSPTTSEKGIYRLYNEGLGSQLKMSHNYTVD